MVRLSCDPVTQAHVARRRAQGKSDREIVRCLKRYVAREVFGHLVRPGTVPVGADLREARLSLASVAGVLGSWPNRISELERGLLYDTDLALRYQAMLGGGDPATSDAKNAA